MKVIFSGLEGSGKSYKLATVVCNIAYRNSEWFKTTGTKRPIASNMKFSNEFHSFLVDKLQVPVIYWENLDELIKLDSCDIFIDEVGNYFDSRMWTELSLDVRRWLTQGSKMGIELYGSAQDFAQIDKAFRRLVNELVHITKMFGSRRPSATKPPVKRIWGLCMERQLDPLGYDEDKKQFSQSGLPSFFFLEKIYCDIFDTTQKITRSKLMPFKHIERGCELENCPFHKVMHV